MKRESLDLTKERELLVRLITDDRVAKELSPIIKPQFMTSPYGKIILPWIIQYVKEFERCPDTDIETLYQRNRDTIISEDEVDSVREFIVSLSELHDELPTMANVDFYIKDSIDFLKKQSVEYLITNLRENILDNKIAKAEQLIANYNIVSKPEGTCIDQNDIAYIKELLKKEDEVAFEFSGDLGEVIGKFYKGDLSTFLGAAKRNKSFWLWHIVQTAIRQNRTCMFISLEMREEQVNRRMVMSMMGKPMNDMHVDFPCFTPFDNNDKEFIVDSKKRFFEGINPDDESVDSFFKEFKLHHREGWFKIFNFPTGSFSVDDLETLLDNEGHYHNFYPEVVVIDYAGLMKSGLKGNAEERHKINDIYLHLRGMAQKRNIHICTATQTNRSGMKNSADADNIGEDYRIVTHVSKLITIDKGNDFYNKLTLKIDRDSKMDKSVVVLKCLDIGRVCIASKKYELVDLDEEDKE